jgi:2,4-dienoyl-CoA reductase-like NADH-dependent reductase (Old Yellow Enzyme family)
MTKQIFETASIGGLALKNRLVRASIWENMAAPGGHPTDKLISFYEELAAGGVGLIITGYIAVNKETGTDGELSGIYDDAFIPEYRKLTDAVHAKGGRIAAQIVYRGSLAGDAATKACGACRRCATRPAASRPVR